MAVFGLFQRSKHSGTLIFNRLLVASVLSTFYLYRREQQFQTMLLNQTSATALRLHRYNKQLEQMADANTQRIAYEVHRNQNQRQDLTVLHQTEEITQRADSLAMALGGMIIHMKLSEPVSPVRNALIPVAGAPACANAQLVAALAKKLQHMLRAARAHLVVQSQEMNQVLAFENNQANLRADGFIKSIEEKILKNRSQPAELNIFRSCQGLRARTVALLDTLDAHRTHLLRLTGNSLTASYLLQPEATDLVSKHWSSGTPAQQSLATQFAGYTAALPVIAADSQKVAPPTLANQPVVSALASLAQTESDLLAAEMQIQRYYEHRVGAPQPAKRIIAAATAESDIVMPHNTYRAHFFLVKQLILPSGGLQMQCNGKPIVVDSNGVGQVKFRAPTQPGPAIWTGSIKYKFNGRDTTFQVRVPYRVARR